MISFLNNYGGSTGDWHRWYGIEDFHSLPLQLLPAGSTFSLLPAPKPHLYYKTHLHSKNVSYCTENTVFIILVIECNESLKSYEEDNC